MGVRPNGDKTFSAFEGTQKAVIKPDGSREVTSEGKWWLTGGTGKFAGVTGGGAYKGTQGVGYTFEGEYETK